MGIPLAWNDETRKIRADFSLDDRHCGFDGIVHGGLIAAALDDAMLWAVRHTVGRWSLTGTFSLRYMHPVPCDKIMHLEAWFVSQSGRGARTQGVLIDHDGLRLVEASALFVFAKNRETCSTASPE